MDSSDARLVVSEFTESMSCLMCFKRKDRYMRVLNPLDLCRIIAAREILSFNGVLYFMYPYQTTLAYPF